MASAAGDSAGYGGARGAGGAVRRKPTRSHQSTPYDRPATAARSSQRNTKRGTWLSKFVDAASKLITAGAHKLFSSVFRKHLLLPSSPLQQSADRLVETDALAKAIATRLMSSRSDYLIYCYLLEAEMFLCEVFRVVAHQYHDHVRKYSEGTYGVGGKKRKIQHNCDFCKPEGHVDKLYFGLLEIKETYNLSLVNHIEDMVVGSMRPDYKTMNDREGKMTESQAVDRIRGIPDFSKEEFIFAVELIQHYRYRDILECVDDSRWVKLIRFMMETKFSVR